MELALKEGPLLVRLDLEQEHLNLWKSLQKMRKILEQRNLEQKSLKKNLELELKSLSLTSLKKMGLKKMKSQFCL